MDKQIILLTKSLKKQNYCTAGIDTKTGQWVRIISQDETIQHAIRTIDMQCEDGTVPDIFDVIDIRCKFYMPNYYQNENFVLDDSCYWNKAGQATIKEVLAIHPPENKEVIFYNTDKKVCDEEIRAVTSNSRYSLMLIKPQNVTIHVKQWPNKNHRTITASFLYNGNWYNYINVTDPAWLNIGNKVELGDYQRQRDVLFVMSLGDSYSVDGCHYKLIAAALGL